MLENLVVAKNAQKKLLDFFFTFSGKSNVVAFTKKRRIKTKKKGRPLCFSFFFECNFLKKKTKCARWM